MSDRSKLVPRYTAAERVNHWFLATTFILVALSGLALFLPAFFFLTDLFGGGPWTRILHPFIGVVMFVSSLGLAARFWGQNRITEADRQWRRRLGDILRNRTAHLPEIGKYNIGQKYLFWTLVATIPLLLLSGIVIWRPYFAPAFGIESIRAAVAVHAFAAFVAIAAILVHIYAAIWTTGSIRAMTRGTVTEDWARYHHPGWYKEVSKETRRA